MSSFHGQTRPDVPRIPQDLATKAYVDGQTHDNFMMLGMSQQQGRTGGLGNTFTGIWNRSGYSNEVNRSFPMGVPGTLSDMRLLVQANTTDGDTIMTNRKNIAPGNMTITIGAGLTGQFTDLTNSDDYVAGDTEAMRLDTSDSTGGSFTMTSASFRYVF